MSDSGFYKVNRIPDPDGVTAPCKCGHAANEHDKECTTCAYCQEYRPQYPGTFRYEPIIEGIIK